MPPKRPNHRGRLPILSVPGPRLCALGSAGCSPACATQAAARCQGGALAGSLEYRRDAEADSLVGREHRHLDRAAVAVDRLDLDVLGEPAGMLSADRTTAMGGSPALWVNSSCSLAHKASSPHP